MPTLDINYIAVIAAAVVSMIVGFFWYGPLFGKQWMALMKYSQADINKTKEAGMGKTYLLMTLSSLVMAYVLAHTTGYANAFYETTGAWAGVMSGFWIWLGFILPVTLGGVLWEGKAWKLWCLNVGYYLASLLFMGVILSTWI